MDSRPSALVQEHELLSAPSCGPGLQEDSPFKGQVPTNEDVEFLMTLDKTSLRTKQNKCAALWDIHDRGSRIGRVALEIIEEETLARNTHLRDHGSLPPCGRFQLRLLTTLMCEAKNEVAEYQGDDTLGSDVMHWFNT